MKYFSSILLGSGLVAAVPNPVRYCGTNFIDTYDSPAQQQAGLVPNLANVGGTAGGALFYNSTLYINDAATLATLTPPSPPDVIGYASQTELISGQQPGWFPMGSYKYFDQNKICGACAVASQEPVAVPTTCGEQTIQFTGVSAISGLLTPVVELVFNPGSQLPVHFQCIDFPSSFKGVKSVNVQLAQAPLPDQATVVLFDNNTYTAYKSC